MKKLLYCFLLFFPTLVHAQIDTTQYATRKILKRQTDSVGTLKVNNADTGKFAGKLAMNQMVARVATKATLSSLATVATTGAYSDITGKPMIPSAQVNSDWNSSSGVSQILNKPTIPTNTNQITNGSGYITGNQNITVTGDVTGSGTTAITTILKNTGTAGTYPKVTTDAQGRVVSGTTLSVSDIPLVLAYNTLNKSANYTILSGDFVSGRPLILDLYVDATAGNVTVTLPIAIGGAMIYVTRTDATANTVTVGGFTLLSQNQSRTFLNNGTNWYNH